MTLQIDALEEQEGGRDTKEVSVIGKVEEGEEVKEFMNEDEEDVVSVKESSDMTEEMKEAEEKVVDSSPSHGWLVGCNCKTCCIHIYRVCPRQPIKRYFNQNVLLVPEEFKQKFQLQGKY